MGDPSDRLPEDDHEPFDDDVLPETSDESMVARAKRRHGMAGAILAGGMVALDQVLGRKVKEEPGIVVESSGDPGDIDADGITVPVDHHTAVHAPPPSARRAARTVRRTRR
jgi:hypothetical protein